MYSLDGMDMENGLETKSGNWQLDRNRWERKT